MKNLYIVMEYLPGGDLYSLLSKVGCLGEDVAKIYTYEIVQALKYLRENKIIHRDIKPDNIMIAEDGHLKLTDFGLSYLGIQNKYNNNSKEDQILLKLNIPPNQKSPSSFPSKKSFIQLTTLNSMRKTNYYQNNSNYNIKNNFNNKNNKNHNDLESNNNKSKFKNNKFLKMPIIHNKSNLQNNSSSNDSLNNQNVLSSNDNENNNNLLDDTQVNNLNNRISDTLEVNLQDTLEEKFEDIINTIDNKEELEEIASSGSLVGTPDYIAPEILLKQKHTYTADYWSLGVMVYEFLTGIPPFHGDTESQTHNNIIFNTYSPLDPNEFSPEVIDFVHKLLQPDPQNRLGFNNISEILEHPFLKGLDNPEPPFIPQVDGPMDTSYFQQRISSPLVNNPNDDYPSYDHINDFPQINIQNNNQYEYNNQYNDNNQYEVNKEMNKNDRNNKNDKNKELLDAEAEFRDSIGIEIDEEDQNDNNISEQQMPDIDEDILIDMENGRKQKTDVTKSSYKSNSYTNDSRLTNENQEIGSFPSIAVSQLVNANYAVAKKRHRTQSFLINSSSSSLGRKSMSFSPGNFNSRPPCFNSQDLSSDNTNSLPIDLKEQCQLGSFNRKRISRNARLSSDDSILPLNYLKNYNTN